MTAVIPVLKAEEKIEAHFDGVTELPPSRLWEQMRLAGWTREERLEYFARRAKQRTAAERPADLPAQYNAARRKAAGACAARVAAAVPVTAAALLDALEAAVA